MSNGAAEVHPCDWAGDNKFDLYVQFKTAKGFPLLINNGTNGQPRFQRGQAITVASSASTGGGDWNNDGVEDLLVEIRSAQYQKSGWDIHLGRITEDGKHRFDDKTSLKINPANGFRMMNHDKYLFNGKHEGRTFFMTPYAWNFSGLHKPGSGTIDVVAMMTNPDTPKSPKEYLGDLNFYRMDFRAKTCTLVGTLAKLRMFYPRCSIGDLNGDSCMDIVYSGGGIYSNGSDTQIWVMYGKRKNIPIDTTCRRWSVSD